MSPRTPLASGRLTTIEQRGWRIDWQRLLSKVVEEILARAASKPHSIPDDTRDAVRRRAKRLLREYDIAGQRYDYPTLLELGTVALTDAIPEGDESILSAAVKELETYLEGRARDQLGDHPPAE